MASSPYIYRIFVTDPEFRNKYREHVAQHNKKLREDPLPDAGFDLLCPGVPILAASGSTVSVDFGLVGVMYKKTGMNEYAPVAYTTEPRSSISKTPLRLANSRGIIDAGYRGHLLGKFDVLGLESYSIQPYQRLLQVLAPTLDAFSVELVDRLEDLGVTRRGAGGFGSTGF